MKNIICPVSVDKISKTTPRVVAFITVGLFLIYIKTGLLPIVVFLAFDFFARGFNHANFSLISIIAKPVSKRINPDAELINKAPKLFAARLGGIMSVLIIVFDLINLKLFAGSIALLILSLATLECVLNFCVGCYIYSWIVLPLSQKRN
ncbi:MAG: DUF4395 domain-containing protein [Bacteroidales bacterium]|nr:DUF4395 domain-containing protein [Bacteroidales bacterium]MBN2819154.1 DUF4395 domain-containing protein [Bacteroidales bacterium]